VSKFDTANTAYPVCPHCGHQLDDDEMNADPEDLWALAPDEGRAEIVCPSGQCGKTFHAQGSYRPLYTTAINEDDL
jgi:hypothetical protein